MDLGASPTILRGGGTSAARLARELWQPWELADIPWTEELQQWLRKLNDSFSWLQQQPLEKVWLIWFELALLGIVLLSLSFLLCRSGPSVCHSCFSRCCSCCGRRQEISEHEDNEPAAVEMTNVTAVTSEQRREEQRERRRRAAETLRQQASGKECAFCGLTVFWREAEEHKGRCYHRDCFRCAACGQSLVGVQHGQIDDCLFCDDTSRHCGAPSCLSRVKLARSGYTAQMAARETVNQRLRKSEVAMVAKAQQAAIEEIGDDLDDIVAGMMPTCAICAGPFKPSDQLVMQGMVKFHKDCLEASWALKTVREGVLTPTRACASAPGTLLFKLQFPDKVMTFFLVRVPDDNRKAITVAWVPDLAARASNKRKCAVKDVESPKGISFRAVGELGADIAPAQKLVYNAAAGKLVADLIWKSCGLDWYLRCILELNRQAGHVQAQRADLKVSVAKS